MTATRLLFFVYDYVTSASIGIGTVLAVYLIVGKSWGMASAMVGGMVLGTVVLVAGIMVFGLVGGAFEVFAPGMVIAMAVGMATAGLIVKGGTTVGLMLCYGSVAALAIQLAFHLLDFKLKGEVALDE